MLSAPRTRRACARAGFTLIEVLVAVGLTSIMLWGLLQLFTSATRFSSAVTAQIELAAAGRAALQRMTRELGSAAVLDVGYLYINNDPAEGDSNDFDSIQFVAPVAEGGNKLAHVKYYCKQEVGRKILYRGYDDDTAPSESPSLTPQSFGLPVEAFNIRHIAYNHTSTISSGGLDCPKLKREPGEVNNLPRAVLIELRLRDPNGKASILFSSGVYLLSSGL